MVRHNFMAYGLVASVILLSAPAQTFAENAETGVEGEAGAERDEATLLRELNGLDAGARQRAAADLAGHSSEAAMNGLILRLRSDPVEAVRAAALESLAGFDTDAAREAIANAAQNDRTEAIRNRAAALGAPAAEPTPAPSSAGDESPFAAGATPGAAAPNSQAPQESAQPTAPPVVVQPAPAPPPPGVPSAVDHVQRIRGGRSLGSGIGLLVFTAAAFGVGGGLAGHWETCNWDEDTYSCGKTGAFLASMILFGFGSLFAIASAALIPIGAARLRRSRHYSQRRSGLALISPFIAPRDGGAMIGLTATLSN